MTTGDPVTVADDALVDLLRVRLDSISYRAAARIESLTRDLAEARSKALEEAAKVAEGAYVVPGVWQAMAMERIAKGIRDLINIKGIL